MFSILPWLHRHRISEHAKFPRSHIGASCQHRRSPDCGETNDRPCGCEDRFAAGDAKCPFPQKRRSSRVVQCRFVMLMLQRWKDSWAWADTRRSVLRVSEERVSPFSWCSKTRYNVPRWCDASSKSASMTQGDDPRTGGFSGEVSRMLELMQEDRSDYCLFRGPDCRLGLHNWAGKPASSCTVLPIVQPGCITW